jgi:pimeloyl-ACP methyl ester carboxylesterase
MASFTDTFAQSLDKLALAGLNRRLPDTFETSYEEAAGLETVLAQTRVVLPMGEAENVRADLFSGGYQPVFLETPQGPVRAGISVTPAETEKAPLLLYHHGFSEYPWDKNSSRLFGDPAPFRAHIVRIQAPYHTTWADPLRKGFASLSNVYQMLAGSLRLMAFSHSYFQEQGTPYTVAAGVSWGGITSMLYQATYGQARAVIPLLSSPNLAQVILDTAALFNRPLNIEPEKIQEVLDFTPYYERCRAETVFPVLAEKDLFFRLENHANLFAAGSLVTVPESHITGCWRVDTLRRHILDVLERLQHDDETE